MTTIFEKLKEYQAAHGVQPLNHLQKSHLGRHISAYWYSISNHTKLPVVDSIEDTGTFKVLAYPDTFSEKLTELIDAFYKSIRKRKRIVKKRPVWTHKRPSVQQNDSK